jgi:hypothetical protein
MVNLFFQRASWEDEGIEKKDEERADDEDAPSISPSSVSSPSIQPPSTPPPFICLPAEIRNMIYTYAYSHPSFINK